MHMCILLLRLEARYLPWLSSASKIYVSFALTSPVQWTSPQVAAPALHGSALWGDFCYQTDSVKGCRLVMSLMTLHGIERKPAEIGVDGSICLAMTTTPIIKTHYGSRPMGRQLRVGL